MPTTITMPQLGETVTEGTVERWLKQPGDTIEKYEPVVEVSTDKVNSEVPAPVTGTLRELLVLEGQTVATGTPIAIIDHVGDAPAPTAEPKKAPASAAQTQAPAPKASHSANGHAASAPPPIPADALRGTSPAVRRLAREHGIDVRTISGSGADGRVTAADVVGASKHGGVASPTARGGAGQYSSPVPGTVIPLSTARRIIAERMVESKHTAPHAWSTVEIDVSGAWKWREREKAAFERETGYKLTLLPFFIRAVVESLAAFPLMNARFAEDGIHVHGDVNVGIAVGLPDNLVVPVIKNANDLSIKGLAMAAAELIDRARKSKLTADDVRGGTFTVNNNGANGSILSAPIINGGQAGIVTMEAVVKRPIVIKDDAIAIRHMMNACLSLDHRVVDGYVASGFLADLKKRLEAMGPTGVL
jgi:2-oxoisovalerate dehydrogenase E2 component (dihydrolipoyl transacylase)